MILGFRATDIRECPFAQALLWLNKSDSVTRFSSNHLEHGRNYSVGQYYAHSLCLSKADASGSVY